MSTVAEVIVARDMNLRVLGISGISNMAHADPEPNVHIDHAEVLAATRRWCPA